MKENIGIKSITVVKLSFDFVLDCHVSERILPNICTGKIFPVCDHMPWEMLRRGRNLAQHSQYLYWESLGDIPGV